MSSSFRTLNEQRGRELLYCKPFNVVFLKCNPEFIITTISFSSKYLFGYTKDELIGTSLYKWIHPDDVERIKTCHELIANQKEMNDDCYKILFRFQMKTNRYEWVESVCWIEREENGKIKEITCYLKETHYQSRMFEPLQNADEMYRNIVEDAPDAITICFKGVRLYVNKAYVNILGAKSKEYLLGKSLFDELISCNQFFIKERLEKIEQNIVKSYRWEERIKRVDGSETDVEIRMMPIRYLGKKCVQIIIKDISEQKKFEELMIQSEKLSAVGQLAAGIAHEIRNPLTAIKGFIQLMETDDTPYTKIILDEINRIETIISELLVLSKPQAKQLALANIVDIMKQVSDLLEPHAIMHGVEIYEDVQVDNSKILCDVNQLKQVFINLIKNAIEAMPNGGKINLSIKQDQDYFYVKIVDQGYGITKEDLESIGKPFFTTKEKGTGLGLMICKKIIENHSGTFSIESVHKKGTTIHVKLPINQTRKQTK